MSKEARDDRNELFVMSELKKAHLEIQRIENETHGCMCADCVRRAVINLNEWLDLAEHWGLIESTQIRVDWEKEGKKFKIYYFLEDERETKRLTD